MGNTQSKKKPVTKKLSGHDKAVLDLKVQRDKLRQYQQRRETELAKECLLEGKKEKALLILKKKKYQQELLLKTDQQLENLAQLTSTLEYKQIEAKVLEGLQSGTMALKEFQQQMSLDEVERIMDESAEAVAYQNEISDLLSGKYTSDEDENALLQELEALQTASAMSNIKSLPVADLPIPEHTVPQVHIDAPTPEAAEPILEKAM